MGIYPRHAPDMYVTPICGLTSNMYFDIDMYRRHAPNMYFDIDMYPQYATSICTVTSTCHLNTHFTCIFKSMPTLDMHSTSTEYMA